MKIERPAQNDQLFSFSVPSNSGLIFHGTGFSIRRGNLLGRDHFVDEYGRVVNWFYLEKGGVRIS